MVICKMTFGENSQKSCDLLMEIRKKEEVDFYRLRDKLQNFNFTAISREIKREKPIDMDPTSWTDFWRCIFLWKKREVRRKSIARSSKYLL